jgi:putative spermidine/putrescine transport system substrate-binding protein
MVNPTIQTLEKGEVDARVVWDFNGISYRDQIDPERFDVLVAAVGSVISGHSPRSHRVVGGTARHRGDS